MITVPQLVIKEENALPNCLVEGPLYRESSLNQGIAMEKIGPSIKGLQDNYK